jgi:hypothetical protein
VARRISVEIVGDSRSLERAFGRAQKAGGRFGSAMRTIGKVGLAGFAGGLVGFGLALRAGFSELAEAQKVAAQTRAVIRSTGGVANVSAKHVDTLSTALSRMSGIDDEIVASGANMLLTFTNIRNGIGKQPKIWDMATRAVLDTAVAMGRDVPTTAIMIGKALNDLTVNARGTITGWSALKRVGVDVTVAMMRQGAAFIRAGKPIMAQKLLLRELTTEFGGSARAFGTTMPGALGRLRNAFDEVMAAFATGFLPLINKVATALTTKLADPAFVARVQHLGLLVGTTLYNAFAKIGTWFQTHWPQIQAGFRVAGTWAQRLASAARRIAHWLQLVAHWAGIADQNLAKMRVPGTGGGPLKTLWNIGTHIGPGGMLRAEAAIIKKVVRRGGGGGKGGGRPMVIGGHRAAGGPVMPGLMYRVGERGPETILSGMRGTVIPNGAGNGGPLHVHLHVGSREIAQAILPELQRHRSSSAPSRRGRHGGFTNVALN